MHLMEFVAHDYDCQIAIDCHLFRSLGQMEKVLSFGCFLCPLSSDQFHRSPQPTALPVRWKLVPEESPSVAAARFHTDLYFVRWAICRVLFLVLEVELCHMGSNLRMMQLAQALEASLVYLDLERCGCSRLLSKHYWVLRMDWWCRMGCYHMDLTCHSMRRSH